MSGGAARHRVDAGPAGAGAGRDGRGRVPVYAVTGGPHPLDGGRDLPIESLVTAHRAGQLGGDLQLEYRAIVELAARPVSLVEIGAALGCRSAWPGCWSATSPTPATSPCTLRRRPTADGGPAPEILERLLEGLRAR